MSLFDLGTSLLRLRQKMKAYAFIACLIFLSVVEAAPAPAPAPADNGHHVTAAGASAPSWILPLAPAGYGGPGVINPYSNVNPLNPMASEMEAQAAGNAGGGAPQTNMGPAAVTGQFIEESSSVFHVDRCNGCHFH